MEKLFSVVFLLGYLNGALSVRYYTAENEICISECAKNGESANWCNTANGWGYCSIRKNVDQFERPCRSDYPCGKHGYSYSWCYVDLDSSENNGQDWGYCGNQEENLNMVASNGFFCTDKCQYYDSEKYYWCKTGNGAWDYCSPFEGLDYRNRRCRQGHYCDKYDKNYYWCYVDSDDTVGYCGIDGESKYITSKGYYCASECEMNGKDYFWCYYSNGAWDYCSRTENSDSHGKACLTDYDCAKREGTSYTWCRNTSSDWYYCGHLSADCSETSSPNVNLQQGQRVCDVNDLGNHIHAKLSTEPNKEIYRYSDKNTRTTAKRAISKWSPEFKNFAVNAQPRTILWEGHIHIELQRMVYRKGSRFANIQVNSCCDEGKRTTIAVIQLQAGQEFPVRYIRRALLLSLEPKI